MKLYNFSIIKWYFKKNTLERDEKIKFLQDYFKYLLCIFPEL